MEVMTLRTRTDGLRPKMPAEALQETHQLAMTRLRDKPREAPGEAPTALQVLMLQVLALALVAMDRMVQTTARVPLYLPAIQHVPAILYASTDSALQFRAQVLAVLQPVVFFAC